MQPHYFLYFVVTKLSNVTFVFDSVPAVITVSQETLIIYCVIIFAILGLRIMYFVLEAMQQHLVHLGKAVVCLLFFNRSKTCFEC